MWLNVTFTSAALVGSLGTAGRSSSIVPLCGLVLNVVATLTGYPFSSTNAITACE
jgi:hypothetical protein